MSRPERRSSAYPLRPVSAGFAGAILTLVVLTSTMPAPSLGQKPSDAKPPDAKQMHGKPLVVTGRAEAIIPVKVVRAKLAEPHLTVELRKFAPAPRDTTEVLVELKGGGSAVIGRISIYPNVPFLAPTSDDAQRFVLPVSAVEARRIVEAGAVVVRLQGSHGAAKSASIELGETTLELPESGSEGTTPSPLPPPAMGPPKGG